MQPSDLDPFASLGAVLGSAALGLLKAHTSILDGKLGAVVKPFQPLLVLAAGIGLPYATAALGIAPLDPTAFVTAPLTTLALISLREGWERAAGRKRR
jgi:hypothetical protein